MRQEIGCQQRNAAFSVTVPHCDFPECDLPELRPDIAMTFGPALRIAGLPGLPPGLNRGAALADEVISVAGRIFLRTRFFPLRHHTVPRFAVRARGSGAFTRRRCCSIASKVLVLPYRVAAFPEEFCHCRIAASTAA